MGAQERRVDVGRRTGTEAVVRLGRELRQARRQHGLSQSVVGATVGVSGPTVSRVEQGRLLGVSLVDLSRLLAVVGLELTARVYPSGQPLRDAAHVALLREFSLQLGPGLRWSTEVPLPLEGDRRAWDGLIRGRGWTCGVEAETALTDLQALLRRIALKARDGRVDRVILLVRDTRRTRQVLRESSLLLRDDFPADPLQVRADLSAGLVPSGNAVVVLPASRRRRTPGE